MMFQSSWVPSTMARNVASFGAAVGSSIVVSVMPAPRGVEVSQGTTSSVSPVLGKQEAYEKGAAEAWMVEDGKVTEGTSSNAYIVKGNTVITRPLSNRILAGCTRRALMRLSKEHGVKVEERLFTPEEAYEADEAFLTSASQFVMPIVEIDGKRIGGGQPGPVSRKLRELFLEEAQAL